VFDVGEARHVAAHGEGGAAGRLDLGGDCLGALGPDVGDDHPTAPARQGMGDCLADPAACGSHNRDRVGQLDEWCRHRDLPGHSYPSHTKLVGQLHVHRTVR